MLTLALVYGGESCEHDISVITALTTLKMIKTRYQVYPVYLKEGGFWTGKALEDINFYKSFDKTKLHETVFSNGLMAVKKRFGYKYFKVNCVLMCNHGGAGENGSLSGYFEVANIPYTASGVFGSSACMDKVYTKMLLEKFKFPVVNYRIYRKGYRLEKLEELGYPLIVKPARLGSSVGISYANDRSELNDGLEFSLRFDNKILVEKALENFDEYNCAVCEHGGKIKVSDVEHPIFDKEYLDFEEKYVNAHNQKREIPAEIDEKLRDKIQRMTREIYLLFELKGVVRIDFLYADKKLYVNEINTIPGSLACYLFKSANLSGVDVVSGMVDAAIADFKRQKTLITDFASDVLKNFDGKGGKLSGIKK